MAASRQARWWSRETCLPRTASTALYCAVIVKQVDEKTLSKVGIKELLRAVN